MQRNIVQTAVRKTRRNHVISHPNPGLFATLSYTKERNEEEAIEGPDALRVRSVHECCRYSIARAAHAP